MRLSHTIEYCALIGFSKFLCVIPRKWAFGIGSAIGAVGWTLGIRKELVLSNIANARPDADDAELNRIGKQAARNFGRTITEFIRYGIKDRDALFDLIKIENIDIAKNALAQGKGAIILTGHYGAWALYFAAIAMRDLPLSLLVGKQHNEKIDAFIHKIPGDRVEFISKGRTAIRVILDKLKLGRAVVMVADQHAGKGGLVVPFLGKNASTLPLPGSFAVKYDAPVFIMTGQREADGSHTVTIKELEVPQQATPDQQKIEVVRRYNEELGKIIAARPEQYFWYHRRWREESEPVS
ncbi:Bacterial lipid A biosynthesis acyltransferase superfamily [Verrucomicrobiia bacterium DG1235]|nr:Bacterial lipid A biosynthesis acyltransferase superfamily [Verrucomicrobiae bacterium DG1235]